MTAPNKAKIDSNSFAFLNEKDVVAANKFSQTRASQIAKSGSLEHYGANTAYQTRFVLGNS